MLPVRFDAGAARGLWDELVRNQNVSMPPGGWTLENLLMLHAAITVLVRRREVVMAGFIVRDPSLPSDQPDPAMERALRFVGAGAEVTQHLLEMLLGGTYSLWC